MIEQDLLDLKELQKKQVLGFSFGYKYNINSESNTTDLVILPFPDALEKFNEGLKVFSYETLQLLRSKYYFGINHRCQMFEVLYNTFEDLITKEEKDINDFLTLQVLYSDMIIKLGTVLEDFAGMCFACREYQVNNLDIAKTFLAYSDPISFYESIKSKKGKRKIKQIFNLPESKGELNKIFKNLNTAETDLLWKVVQKSSDLIDNKFEIISSSIVRNTKEDMTYYDMYNKLKHGFSPIFPFVTPMPIPVSIQGVHSERAIEEIISKYFFENLMIMHDKLQGQRTQHEQAEYTQKNLATPAFTYQDVNLETAKDIRELILDITLLYKHLMKKYLLLADGNSEMLMLMSEDCLSEDERQKAESIIMDRDRYNNSMSETVDKLNEARNANKL
ncbi:hypothetical protein [Bacillus cytotoxicus]|uniref:hypothetical protein n=1 Tax=Bacillus cytotoxicus TaxID=580165 RepID=UPI0024483C94|nr:hypothetical protein [Bacillus cytotoxicus]MDH2882517.1 hypothetical protein [Bacillus cytotoxicus]